MMTLYLIALAVGGTLLAVSLLFGGDGDAGADGPAAEMDGAEMEGPAAEADGAEVADDAEAAAPGHGDGWSDALSWLPLASLRFWTFFLAFFGLTGLALRGPRLLGELPAALIAAALGYLSGVMVTAVLRRLRQRAADSTLGERDYIGATARVVLPVRPGRMGKVRLALGGRTVELLAGTQDDEGFERNEDVIVYAVLDDGRVMVARGE